MIKKNNGFQKDGSFQSSITSFSTTDYKLKSTQKQKYWPAFLDEITKDEQKIPEPVFRGDENDF